jgi:hypothetical protein
MFRFETVKPVRPAFGLADLAAGAGGGARERRNRGRVVVGLDLHQRVGQLGRAAVFLGSGLRALRVEAQHLGAFHDRRVVAVGHDGALRLQLVGVLDHLEQRALLLDAVDGPFRVEDLVAAVFAVSLGEHHQLDVGRVALHAGEGVEQVVDFVVGQGEAHLGVGALQRTAALAQHVDRLEWPAFQFGEQGLGLVGAAQHRFRHAVVQQGRHGLRLFRRQLLRCAEAGPEDAALEHHLDGHAALDAVDVGHAAVVRDVGGLRGPRRDRAQARDHEELLGHAIVLRFRHRLAVGEHGGQAFRILRGERAAGVDEVVETGRHACNRRGDGGKLGQEALATECGEGIGTRQNQHG